MVFGWLIEKKFKDLIIEIPNRSAYVDKITFVLKIRNKNYVVYLLFTNKLYMEVLISCGVFVIVAGVNE